MKDNSLTMKCKSLAATLLLLAAGGTQAGLIYDQPATGTAALLASSRYAPNGTDYDQYVWDAFSTPTAQALTEIRWRGGYNPAMASVGGDIVNFKVSIYESTPGLSQPYLGPLYPVSPATLASYDTGDKAGESSAGVFGGVQMYDYHFVLPTVFQAAAGKQYWLQIEAEQQNGLPDWGFATGTGDGMYFRRVAGGADFFFQSLSGDAAFSIMAGDGPVYTVAAGSAPAGGGVIINTGLYPSGSAAPLVATPNAGFAFVNWTEGGTVVSTTPHYTFTVTGDRTLLANFAAGSLITTSAAPLTGGATTGDGSFVNGSHITVDAVPAANFSFVNWTEGGVPVSTAAAYAFEVAADRNLVANFTATATNLGIVFSQPPTSANTILPSAFLDPDGIDGQSFAYESFTTTSTQDISDLRWRGGYDPAFFVPSNPVSQFVIGFYASNGAFLGAKLQGVTIIGNAEETPAAVVGGVQMYDYHVTLPASFHALGGTMYWIQIEAWQAIYPLDWGFAKGAGGNNSHYRVTTGAPSTNRAGDLAITLSAAAPTSYAIAATPSSVAGGSVAGPGTYALAAPVTLAATPAAGYAFVNWTEGAVIVSSAAIYQFGATADRTLVANFQPTYQLTLGSSSASMGTVAGGGTYLNGTSVTATATPKTGYVFLNWKEGAMIVNTSPSYTFTILSSRSLVANFAVGFTVAASASPAPGGTVSGAGGYAQNATVTLEATPASGYAFVNWTEGATLVSSAAIYQFPATANRTLVANFQPTYQLTLDPSSATMGTVAGGGIYPSGTSVTATASPLTGYLFLNWSEGGTIVSTSPGYTFTILSSRSLVANFTAGFTVAASASFGPGGTVSGAGEYAQNATVTLEATPATGYQFTNWTELGTVVSSNSSYSFTAAANRTLVANFVPILGVSNGTPGIVGLSWPASASGWILQENPDLIPANWVPSSLQVTTSGGQNLVTITNPTGTLFFRLAYP
ncbi:MAG: hypothetical protein NTW21_32780 [Verrucomicrobia bacterium]|nr:hypothetical protein [Verrucomicrobiota bacterium]